jgi:flagellar biosynthesis protein FliQ
MDSVIAIVCGLVIFACAVGVVVALFEMHDLCRPQEEKGR